MVIEYVAKTKIRDFLPEIFPTDNMEELCYKYQHDNAIMEGPHMTSVCIRGSTFHLVINYS